MKKFMVVHYDEYSLESEIVEANSGVTAMYSHLRSKTEALAKEPGEEETAKSILRIWKEQVRQIEGGVILVIDKNLTFVVEIGAV